MAHKMFTKDQSEQHRATGGAGGQSAPTAPAPAREQAILAAIEARGFDPNGIRRGEKKIVGYQVCQDRPDLFNPDKAVKRGGTFDGAWSDLKKKKRIRILRSDISEFRSDISE